LAERQFRLDEQPKYPTVFFAVAISASTGFALKPSKLQAVLGRSCAAHHETAITGSSPKSVMAVEGL
jgi:hypothetical protein